MEQQIYHGITPYDEDVKFKFRGRQSEISALYERVLRNDYTVYYAASGEGKSSLIKAGLIPILRIKGFFPIYITFKDDDFKVHIPIEEIIYSRISDELSKHPGVTYERSEWSISDKGLGDLNTQQIHSLESNAWWKLRNFSFKEEGDELKPLFIFDQFEDVFTKTSYEWANTFFNWLEEISTDYLPKTLKKTIETWEEDIEIPTKKNFKALFSFRTEYLGDFDYWCTQKHYLPSLQDNRLCLKPLTAKGACDVIALNPSLDKYSDRIIQGCSENGNIIVDENSPSVFALILSVVCQTLSIMPNDERESFLNELGENQEQTINRILLSFYKKKLGIAGLDYIKDEKIIEQIESALVDENGKRRRRDTDETSIVYLNKWITELAKEENGLIKVVGKREKNGNTVRTIEFPHDRLCKAIDSARRERQGRLAEILRKQKEWTQFIFITAVLGVVMFLWSSLMTSIKPIIHLALNSDKGNGGLINQLGNYIFNPQDISDPLLIKGFSSILLMIFLCLFMPLLAVYYTRKDTKRQRFLMATISTFSVCGFSFLCYKNFSVVSEDRFLSIITLICLFISIGCFLVSCYRLKVQNTFPKYKESHLRWWPLWGSYFIFTSYVFYECLFRVTFGTNEPVDSFWSIVVLPILYVLWAWEFFDMKIKDGSNVRKPLFIILLGILSLISLAIIRIIPPYNIRSFAFPLSVFMVFISILILWYLFMKTDTNSKYFVLSSSKRMCVICGGTFVVIGTFLLQLGYNPLSIKPSSVCHVSSWRSVITQTKTQNDSVQDERLGIRLAINGETILPNCLLVNTPIDSMLKKGDYPYTNGIIGVKNKIEIDPIKYAGNKQLKWNKIDSVATGLINVVPTLEEYLFNIRNAKIQNQDDLKILIDYYAAELFSEIRKANIEYLLSGGKYNYQLITSLSKLDSLQNVSLGKELQKLDSLIITKDFTKNRNYIDALEAKHLVDFQRELSRSFFLCQLKDRVIAKDVQALFILSNMYSLTFFETVKGMKVSFASSNNMNINNSDKTGVINVIYKISSIDLLEKKEFAWYDLFLCLCKMDIMFNAPRFTKLQENKNNNLYNLSNELLNELEKTNHKLGQLISSDTHSLKRIEEELSSSLEKIDSFATRLRVKDVIGNTNNDYAVKQMTDSVLNTLLKVVKYREDGMYNGFFENICRHLILVSCYRGNNIQTINNDLNSYLDDKTKFYNLSTEVSSSVSIAEFKDTLLRSIDLYRNSTYSRYSMIKKLRDLLEKKH